MNRILFTSIFFATSHVAHAAMLDIVETPGANGTIYALTLTADEQFNGFGINITPVPPSTLLNAGPGGLTDGPSAEKTFFSVFLTPPSWIDGPAITGVGVEVAVDQMRGDYGLLGGYIDASRGIYLGNVVLPHGGMANYSIVLQDTGNDVARLGGVIGIPEPATRTVAGTALLGLVFCLPRNNICHRTNHTANTSVVDPFFGLRSASNESISTAAKHHPNDYRPVFLCCLGG